MVRFVCWCIFLFYIFPHLFVFSIAILAGIFGGR